MCSLELNWIGSCTGEGILDMQRYWSELAEPGQEMGFEMLSGMRVNMLGRE